MSQTGSKKPQGTPGAKGREWIGSSLRPLGGRFDKLLILCLRSGGEDPVHDLRVVSRRLREGLTLFRPWLPSSRRRKLKRRLRRVTRALGTTRDWDVATAFFAAPALPGGDPWPAACDPARRRMEKRCRRLRRGSVGAMKEALVRGRAQRIPGRIDRLLERLPGDRVTDGTPDPSAVAPGLLRDRLRAVFAQDLPAGPEGVSGSGSVAGSESDAELRTRMHRTRIAVKKLRYALEYLRPADPEFFEQAIRRAKGLQDVFGLHQDLRVFRDLVEEAGLRHEDRSSAGSGRGDGGSRAGASWTALSNLMAILEKIQARAALEQFHREAPALRDELLRTWPENLAS